MEGGDLATWDDRRQILVLEGVLARVPERRFKRRGVFGREPLPLPPAFMWDWSVIMMKSVNTRARMYTMTFDVVTFRGEEVADIAAEFLANHGVQVTGCVPENYDLFCASLTWRPSVERVIDSDTERLMHYGAKAYELPFGQEL